MSYEPKDATRATVTANREAVGPDEQPLERELGAGGQPRSRLAVAGDRALYDLETNGQLWRYSNNSWGGGAFDSGINWTLGLPFIRTSPDHGTAYDIAGKGIANPGSMIAAIRLAKQLAKNRR